MSRFFPPPEFCFGFRLIKAAKLLPVLKCLRYEKAYLKDYSNARQPILVAV
jgi:superoxide dismutase